MSVEALTPRQLRLSLGAVIASVFGVGVSFGAVVPLITLLLERQGVSTTVIGLNAAMFPVATLIVGLFVPRIIGRLGTMTSLYLGVGVCCGLMLLFPLLTDLWVWFVLRFLIGAASAIHWVVSETWLNSSTNERNRGLIMGVYATVLAGGFTIGPFAIGLVGIDGWLPFLFVSVALATSAVPIMFAHSVAPPMPHRHGTSVLRFVRIAPMIMLGAIVGGLIDNAVFSLMPVYGLQVGFDEESAVLLLSVFLAGNLALQVPLGWVADRTGRPRMLLVCVGVSLIGAALLPQLVPGGAWASEALLWPMLFLWGGMAFGVYTIGISLLADRFERGLLAAANTAYIMAYECGTLVGPVAAGRAMDTMGANGLVVVVGVTCAAFLLFCLARSALARRALPEA